MDSVQEQKLITIAEEFLREFKKYNKIELAKLYLAADKQWTDGQRTINQYLEALKDW